MDIWIYVQESAKVVTEEEELLNDMDAKECADTMDMENGSKDSTSLVASDNPLRTPYKSPTGTSENADEENQSDGESRLVKLPSKQNDCAIECSGPSDEHMIQCSSRKCLKWYHFFCTDMPAYYLSYLNRVTGARFICDTCEIPVRDSQSQGLCHKYRKS